MKKEQIIEKYKEKYSSDIIHPCQLTIHELQMLDFCIEYFAEQKELEVRTAEETLTKVAKEYGFTGAIFDEMEYNMVIIAMHEFASQFQQPEIMDEKIKKALENLIFTAGKLWDEIKPIKDTEIRTVTHPIIEEAKIILASLSQQPITDENIIVNIQRILVDYHRRDDYDLTKAENDMLCLFRNTFISPKSQPERGEQP